ncbi:MAG: choice-of-anchor J domain-containing protein, partial [Bacteroidota bacterium]
TTDFALNIDPTESSIIDFAPITMDPGTTTISFEIVLTNGVTDGASPSNTKSLTVLVPESITVPFLEDFETGIANWSIQNPDQNLTWTSTTAPKSTPANQGLAMDFYNYEDHVGEVDIFLSPVFDLSSSPAAALSFDVAYARYGSSTEDRLRVMVITNCDDIANGTIVYDKGGATLSTIPNLMTSPFVPAGEDDWRKEFVNINQFIGETHVQLAFIGINDFGNNLYIDNIAVLTEDYEDIGIGKIVSPSLVTCDDASAVKLMVQSLGNVPINNFKVTYQVNNDPVQQTTVSGLNLGLGEEILVTLPEVNLNEGNNIIVVNLVDPNGVADQTPDNNQVTFKVVINKSEDRIPLREKFDTGTTQWIMVNPSDGMNWQYSKSTIEGFDQSISFNASSNEVPGDQAWLVSPVIDFSAAKEASMLFDASYVSIKETLEIMASTDCGNTYQKVIFSLPDITATPTSNWKPKTPDDWTKNILVNLNTLAGEPDVRLAFVITNGHGNNFHLDNIELYTTDFPDPIEIGELFSVYGYALGDPTQNNFKITFNLPERQDVRFSIVDTMGKLLVDHTFPDVLNQTYPLDLEGNLTPGLYIIRLKIGTTYKATKVLVGR